MKCPRAFIVALRLQHGILLHLSRVDCRGACLPLAKALHLAPAVRRDVALPATLPVHFVRAQISTFSRQLSGTQRGACRPSAKAKGRCNHYWPIPRDIGRSDLSKSAAASPVDEMSSAPVAARTSFAFLAHSLLSQWMESKMPPDLMRPS